MLVFKKKYVNPQVSIKKTDETRNHLLAVMNHNILMSENIRRHASI